MEGNMVVIKEPQNIFYFNFDLSKDVDKNLNHETELIIKRNESLAENKTNKEIDLLLPKYKHGNNIHEHRK